MNLAAALPGYAKLSIGDARGLVMEACREPLQTILASETLYEHASRQPGARAFKGRRTAYSLQLGEQCGTVVVRHSVRGGLLGKTGSDLFLPPTRGLRELVNSLRLRVADVPTPEIVAIITYKAGPILRRGDVATREISDSHDLAVVLQEMPPGADRDSCLRATGKLLESLARAGAHHPDLNARNVLITWEGPEGAHAYVLDVDRIRFHVPGDPMVAQANLERLERSLNKLQSRDEIALVDGEMDSIRRRAQGNAVAG